MSGRTGLAALQIVNTIGGIVFAPYTGGASLYAAAGVNLALGVGYSLYEQANAPDNITRQDALGDLRLQTSTLGGAMLQVFGVGRVAGNIIWATDKELHENRDVQSAGGKGGGPQTVSITNTYTISLALALCNTRVSGPMDNVLQVWKNGTQLGPGMQPNWTFYPGTSTQLPDPTMEAALGVGNVPAYRYTCYIVMEDEDLKATGQLPQWNFEVGQVFPAYTLRSVVTKLSNAAGLSGAALDVTGLPEDVDSPPVGMTLVSVEAARASLEQLAFAYRFYGLETGETFAWRQVGAGSIVGTIPEADGSAGEERASETGAQLDRAAPLELPTMQYLTYLDQAQFYQRNTQPSSVILPPSGRENPKNATTNLVLSANDARRLSTELVVQQWVQREPYADVLPRKYCYLEPGDKVNCEARGLTYPVVLGATTYGAPGLVEIQGRVNGSPRLGTVATSATQPVDGTVHDSTTIPPGAVTPPATQTPHVVDDTTPLLLNLPVLDSSDQAPRYHVAYIGENEPWEGGALFRSVDGSATFQAIDASALEGITGTVAVALATVADWTVLDTVNTFSVVLEYGTLQTINATANAAGVQRVMVGSEMVYVGVATLTATRTYTCSQLWRGRQGTDHAVAGHGTNEAFVLLDSAVHRLAMTTSERGVSYAYKAVSNHQDIAAASVVNFTPTAENLIPWRVLPPLASRPVQDWQVRWYMRSRFVPGGQDQDFIGFQVKIYSSNTFGTVLRTINTSGGYALDPIVLKGVNYTAAQQVVDFGSVQTTLYFTVAQVGAYATGRVQNMTSSDVSTAQAAIEPVVDLADCCLSNVEVTTTTQATAVQTRYIINVATLCTLTLPATAVLGDTIKVDGEGPGLWLIAQNAGQKIHVRGRVTTTGTGGSLAARHAHDAVTLECVVAGASTEWEVV